MMTLLFIDKSVERFFRIQHFFHSFETYKTRIKLSRILPDAITIKLELFIYNRCVLLQHYFFQILEIVSFNSLYFAEERYNF